MRQYEYECPECGKRTSAYRPMAARNEPMFCLHQEDGQVRIVKAPRIVSQFVFTANLSKDLPENSLARIITKSSSSEDQLNYLRSQEKRAEAQAREIEAHSQEVDPGFGGIDIQGAWTAAHAGKEQLARWRKDNIAPDPLAMGSAE